MMRVMKLVVSVLELEGQRVHMFPANVKPPRHLLSRLGRRQPLLPHRSSQRFQYYLIPRWPFRHSTATALGCPLNHQCDLPSRPPGRELLQRPFQAAPPELLMQLSQLPGNTAAAQRAQRGRSVLQRAQQPMWWAEEEQGGLGTCTSDSRGAEEWVLLMEPNLYTA